MSPVFSPLSDSITTRSYAALRETTSRDATEGSNTSYRMAVGDTFTGALSYGGDRDWIAIDLRAGQGIQVKVQGVGTRELVDPMLAIYDSSGRALGFSDDVGERLDPALGFYAQTAGRYYIAVGGYTFTGNPWGVGDYRISVGAGAYTPVQIARQLTNDYWENDGLARRAFAVAPGGALNVDLSDLPASARALAVAALEAWSGVSGIKFNLNPTAGQKIHIAFDDNDRMSAYSESVVNARGQIISSSVTVSADWVADYGSRIDSYSYQTYLHEIGHALGLGHAGNYNGSATYNSDNLYVNDSWQATTMSYFSQDDNSAIRASYAYTLTPMIADILAIRSLYGAAQMRTGDTVYGEVTNAGGIYAKIAPLLTSPGRRGEITFTIQDDGGHDRLVLQSDTRGQHITLVAGGISNAYGRVGNISIAHGTVIEDFVAGSGADHITGNAAHNTIWGGAGNDTILGGLGNDTLWGGAGNDRLIGGAGNDTYGVAELQDVVVEYANGGIDTVNSARSYVLGAYLENLTLQGNAALTGTGNGLGNVITGNQGANKLFGLGGNDRLDGGAGHDTLYGGVGNDTLWGGFGNDWLDGQAGRDTMRGHGGNDTYVTDGQDLIIESAGQGYDSVRSSGSYALTANVERLVLVGTASINGVGNGSDNVLIGNLGNNQLSGGWGNDVLDGGRGNDRLRGGLGADTFVFNAGRDTILDFQDNIDTVQLSRSLWGGQDLSVAQVLRMASVVAGTVVFDFGQGNSLHIDGLTRIAALSDDLSFV